MQAAGGFHQVQGGQGLRLTGEILATIEELEAEDVRLGARYAGVSAGGRIGVAMTMSDGADPPGLAGRMRGARICELALSENLLEATVGVAAMNAHLRLPGRAEKDAFERIMEIAGRFRVAGVVGRFPFVEQLRGECEVVHVFEKRALPGCLPAEAAEELLPRCDLVIITGTSMVNHTLERLLEISGGHTMVIGPTTPMSSVLFEHGADAIAGVEIDDPAVLDVVGQGGGTREFMKLTTPVLAEKAR